MHEIEPVGNEPVISVSVGELPLAFLNLISFPEPVPINKVVEEVV